MRALLAGVEWGLVAEQPELGVEPKESLHEAVLAAERKEFVAVW